MQPWTQFYTAIGTASAALLGLLFVVVSINVSVALGPEEVVSKRLTEQAFQNYLAVMMVAFLALFPGISTTTFGLVTLITTAGWSAWVVIRFCQALALDVKRRSWIYPLRRHVSSLIGFGILLVSAFRMALHWGEPYNWFAASTLVLLFSATAVSWELVRRIANR
jgi:hypothetical protein